MAEKKKMKRGETHIDEGGNRLRAGRFPSGHTYAARRASKSAQKAGAPVSSIEMRGPSGKHVRTKAKKGESKTETYKPMAGLRNAGGLVKDSVKKKNTFKQAPKSGWPNDKPEKKKKGLAPLPKGHKQGIPYGGI